MVWPPGSVKTSDHPLIAELAVLVRVMLSVRPVFHALTVSVTRQAPVETGGLEGGALEGGALEGEAVGEAGGELVGVEPVSRPKNAMAAAAMPLCGRLCPAPWMLYASTSTVPDEVANRLRFQPDR